jgi:phenylacetate-CoA ligase
MDLIELYHKLPFWLQNVALSVYGLVLQRRYYGDDFSLWCNMFDGQERWGRARIEQYQLVNLEHVLELAITYVPYYRDAFKSKGKDRVKLSSLDDLREFPILEKEAIRQDSARFIDDRLDASALIPDRTSGSTGTPLVLHWPKSMFPKWWALHERRVRAWANVAQTMPRAMIGGRTIVKGDAHGPYWRYNYVWRQLYMSSYHISNLTAPDYIRAMRHYGSQWITGYGSAIALLGEWLCDHPSQRPFICAALTSGDDLFPAHRKAIENGFGCRVFDYYGSAEGCLVISECEYSRMHVQPESGVLEILNESGEPCRPGEVGEMIVTGLLNDAMPLVRYRTGDMAAWSAESHCPCGRRSPLIGHIEGRADDYLILQDGRSVGRLSTAIKKSLTIRSAQIAQDAPNHAWLLIRPGEGYEDYHGEIVKQDILARIGKFKLDVVTVETLPKTVVGKQRLVVRLFDRPELAKLYRKHLSKF